MITNFLKPGFKFKHIDGSFTAEVLEEQPSEGAKSVGLRSGVFHGKRIGTVCTLSTVLVEA